MMNKAPFFSQRVEVSVLSNNIIKLKTKLK